ncbi:OmpA family protein [Shewanella baltica]|uniref:OmpA/MotB domain protein n=1 Tax=Shewanella baltica (strain OS155 / ATCC BAA-1091) TaxID=325240 RepID=A3DB37_SHEB5|nr:OmpA family protein [Shewanella baltica]ABN63950.1 OmpA/MotB domain protein [Shewanella baltica OS155]AEH16453.1 OmpA/MotB domain protein [Shewanella baltica OS117]
MKKYLLPVYILLAPAWASTESPLFFIEAKGGYQWASDDSYKHSNPKGAIFGVSSGLQFSPAWSWDVGYQYHDDLKADATSVNVKAGLIESALRYDWYLQDNLSVYGRLGVAYWDMEKTHLSSDKLDATGLSPLGEVGVNYNFTPNVRLSAGYQYIDSIGESNTGKYDSHGFLVGLTYAFGHAAQPTLIKELSTPATKTVIVETSPQTLTFSSKSMNVIWGFDATKLSHDFIEQLAEVVEVLNTYPQARVAVLAVGHADSIGSEAYNQALSEKRAQTVANKLLELGVSPAQIEVQGEGESHPVANNQTADGRAKNRRVEVSIPSFQYQKQAVLS